MTNDQQPQGKTPFQQVTDAMTDGCGCACHTGVGYLTACRHCVGDDPKCAFYDARGVISGDEPSEDIVRRGRDQQPQGLAEAIAPCIICDLWHRYQFPDGSDASRHDGDLMACVNTLLPRLAEANERIRQLEEGPRLKDVMTLDFMQKQLDEANERNERQSAEIERLAEGNAERLAARAKALRYEKALREIDRYGCAHFVTPYRCSDPVSGKTLGAQDGADAWCDPCIARDALEGGES